MPTYPLPAKLDLVGDPETYKFQEALGALYEHQKALLGATGSAAAARIALGIDGPFEEVAAGSTTAVGATASANVLVSGAATINSLGAVDAGIGRRLYFSGACQLVKSANLVIHGGASWTTAAGDQADVISLGSGVWQVFPMPLASFSGGASAGMIKADPMSPAFFKTGAGSASIKAGTTVPVAGKAVSFAADTAIIMPTLVAGTDYAIWVKDDGTIQASSSFSAAPGAGNWRKSGGFHYAPGGNAAAQAGGDTTPAINPYSFWDLKFRPACPDPRGMTLVADSFWADIYLLGVDHLTNGTSKYNVSIADGSAPPKIPTKFGGTGSNAYSTLNWWEANEVLQSWGKRLPTYDEFAALAYGTTEATASGGSDVPTTGVSGTGATNAWNKFTSRWGVIQATGCMWIWGGEFGGGAAGASWTANTGGRGGTYQMENVVLLGGAWSLPTEAGSRCSGWGNSPTYSGGGVGARGVCDHLVIE